MLAQQHRDFEHNGTENISLAKEVRCVAKEILAINYGNLAEFFFAISFVLIVFLYMYMYIILPSYYYNLMIFVTFLF